MDRTLDQLSVDMIGDVLRDWLRIQDHAEQLYQDLPPEWRRHVEQTGSDYSGLASTFASHLHPNEREVTRAVLRDAIAGLDSLSHPAVTVEGRDVDAGNGASDVGDGGDLAERVTQLERRLIETEALMVEAVQARRDLETRIILASAALNAPTP